MTPEKLAELEARIDRIAGAQQAIFATILAICKTTKNKEELAPLVNLILNLAEVDFLNKPYPEAQAASFSDFRARIEEALTL